MTAFLTLLTIMGGLSDIGGFALDHPHFWKHKIPEGQMKAMCANAFKSYDPESGLWTDLKGVKHHCPPNE